MVALAREFVREARVFGCPADRKPAPLEILVADYEEPNSARTSYEFYSLWRDPRYGPVLTQMQGPYGSAPVAMDLGGGDANDSKRNHKGGGNVVFADGHADWQDAKKWDAEDMADPADEFWPKGPDGQPL